tara:strand:- start:359 stop:559 length:201 start_codon:yes stop_codon:yes gene_type:complete
MFKSHDETPLFYLPYGVFVFKRLGGQRMIFGWFTALNLGNLGGMRLKARSRWGRVVGHTMQMLSLN